MRHYLDRQVTPPKKATSPILGPLPSCKQALTLLCQTCSSSVGEDRGWNQENRAQEVVEERVENGKEATPKNDQILILHAPVVQTLDSAIHQINHYPVDKYQGNRLRYTLDRFLSSG